MRTKLNSCAIFAIATVATAALMTTGCSKDEEYDMQTYDDEYTLAEPMMTRSAEAPSGDSGPQYLSNECGIWCILRLRGNTDSQRMYSQVVDSALYRLDSPWDRDYGAPLYGDQMVQLGNMFNLGFSGWSSNKDALGNYTGKATEQLTTLLNDPSKYDNKGKLQNVIISIKYKGSTHYVVVRDYDANKRKLYVYDVNATNSSNLTTIPMSDVLGVIY